MSAVATTILLLVTGLAGLGGFRIGRRRVLSLGCALVAGAAGISLSALIVGHFGLGLPSLVAVAVLIVVLLSLRLRLGSALRDASAGHLGWRIAGLLLSVLVALPACQLLGVALAALGWNAPPPIPAAVEPTQMVEPDPWSGVRALGTELGQLSGSLLGELPVIGGRSTEMIALLQILNADQAQLARMADHHRLRDLAQRPAVAAALQDQTLLDGIEHLKRGDLAAFQAIMDSPSMEALQADVELRRLVAGLSLSDLAAAMD